MATSDLFTETWYRNAFDRPVARNKVLGDITPEYCTVPDEGLVYVRRLLGAVKIIFIIREPVERALSQMRMMVERRGHANRSYEDWLALAEDDDIWDRGDYLAYVPRWRAHWPDGDLLFIPYGRISTDPVAVMRSIEDFLGLSRVEYTRAADRIHGTKSVDVPKFVVQRLEERLAPQRRFLEAAFDVSFLREI